MNFYQTVSAAVKDFIKHGFDSEARMEKWTASVRKAAEEHLIPEKTLTAELRRVLKATFDRETKQVNVKRKHKGVSKFKLQNVPARLHAELERRILTSAKLIKLNRETAIDDTVRRFAGWASSVPRGGSRVQSQADTKKDVVKPLNELPFRERRVLIDQGHKFSSALNDVLAKDSGAIAAVWHSNWRQKNYDYREEHKERDDKVYLIRGSWAHEKGLVKPGAAGYYDEITQPGEEIFCRCWCTYLYSPGQLPDDMLTQKGRDALEALKKEKAA